jgi:hypothetical protein
MQLFKDGVSGGGPLERLAVCVVRGDKVIDALHKLFDAGERASPNGLVGDQREKALDLVEPGAVGRDEVHVPAWPCRQPRLDLRMAVRGVVIDDAVDVQLGRHSRIDFAQEGQELLVPVTRLAGCQHRSVEHIQRSKQRGRAVSLVVVGDALDVAEAHGQHRLSALQRLALALLVHADHQGIVRRAQVQADDVAQLLDEERVVLEMPVSAATVRTLQCVAPLTGLVCSVVLIN